MNVSLGFNCATAYRLQQLGYRDRAFPFDWLVIKNFENIIKLIQLNDFDNVIDNLEFVKKSDIHPHFEDNWSDSNIPSMYHHNEEYGVDFIHDFSETTDKEEVKQKYRRRIGRLRHLDNITFIRDECNKRTITQEHVDKLLSLFPKAKLMIIFNTFKKKMQHLDNVILIEDKDKYGGWSRPNLPWKELLLNPRNTICEPSIQPTYYRNKITLDIYYDEEAHYLNDDYKILTMEHINMHLHMWLTYLNSFNIKNCKSITILCDLFDNISFVIKYDNEIKITKGTLVEYVDKMKFLRSPLGFFQINSYALPKMWKLIDVKSVKNILICLGGQSPFAHLFSKHYKRVIGISNCLYTVEDAIKNAEINNITNCEFYYSEHKDILLNYNDYDVFVNAGRTGLKKEVCELIKNNSHGRVYYIACKIESLLRDLKLLNAENFDKYVIFDNFPNTNSKEIITSFKY